MNPYRARQNTTTLIVIEYGLAPYIICSAESKNLSRIDGLSVDLISGLALSCSLSVGILLIMERVLDEGQNECEVLVRVNIRVEHFSYAPHPKEILMKLVASLYHLGPLATVRMVGSDIGSGTICHTVGPTLRTVRFGKRW